MKLKKLLSYFLAFAICATVLSISLYASVTLKPTAPTTATVDITGEWNIDVSTLFEFERVSHTIWYDEYLDPSGFSVTVNETPEGAYGYDSENKNMFSFEPDYADAGNTFSFTFYVRGSGGMLGTENNHTITVTVTANQEDTPNAIIDFVNDRLTGLVPFENYTLSAPDGTTLSDAATENGELTTIDGFLGETTSIVKNGDGISTVDSDPQIIELPDRPSAPSLTGVMASAAGNDGKIIGLDTAKTYKCSDNTYTDVTEITGLAPGEYTVYIAAVKDVSFASMEATVVVPEYPTTVNNALILPAGLSSLWYGNDIYQIPQNISHPLLGGGSYSYDSVSSTLTFNNVSFTTSSYHALRLQGDPKTLNINGTNLIKSTSINIGNAVVGAVTITGTGSLTAEHARGPVFSQLPTVEMTDYTWEEIDDKKVIITYKAPKPVITPEPKPEPQPANTPHYSNTPPPSPPIVPKTYTIDGGTITLPSNNPKIKTEIRFNSKRTAQTIEYVADKWGIEALSCFETAQKGGWGDKENLPVSATITISLEKLGLKVSDGTEFIVLIFDTKTKTWHQVEAVVIDGNIVIETEYSGIFVIVKEKVL
ncbi:MAG: hypothetical protein LBM41_00830 [Ruminococcus sp.]|jgi:hypothetical protein|nr:hypothetical protein [Ruminococcus sp.]